MPQLIVDAQRRAVALRQVFDVTDRVENGGKLSAAFISFPLEHEAVIPRIEAVTVVTTHIQCMRLSCDSWMPPAPYIVLAALTCPNAETDLPLDFPINCRAKKSMAALSAHPSENGFHRDFREGIACVAPIGAAKYFSHRFPGGGTALHAP
jgi:hypothetical protein